MINTDIISMPAYTTREFRNYGLHKADSLYKFMFTMEDRALLDSGAIKLFPIEMCNFTVKNSITLAGKKYKSGTSVDVSSFDEKVLNTLVKTGVLICSLKEEYNTENTQHLIKQAELRKMIGKNLKEVCLNLSIDFEQAKETLNLKQGANKKKLTKKDLDLLSSIL